MADTRTQSIHDILFVCTGNICRSPFGEASLRAKLFQNSITDVRVSSAGTIGGQIPFCPQEAVIAAEDFALDLSHHRSRLLTESSCVQGDLIIVMEDSHTRFITKHWDNAAKKIRPLSDFDRKERKGRDIPDPYGSSIDYYRVVYRQIDEALNSLVQWLKET
jgi:protein-tyrosine-phosphatase